AQGSDSTWTCGFHLAGGMQAEAVWNSSVSTSSTVTFRPGQQYQSYRSLDGSTLPIAGGTLQVGANPILLMANNAHLAGKAGGQ
ncbi:MAG: hypothetical protein ACRD4Y_15645, partial [Candidatus Acidiferrales bacterium]